MFESKSIFLNSTPYNFFLIYYMRKEEVKESNFVMEIVFAL